MNDLISRQTVINEINERQRKLIYCFGFENDMVKIMDIAKSIVIAMPSAQPEPKTGHWIILDSDSERYEDIKCPFCGHTFTVDAGRWCDIGFIKEDFKFCPNCGADTRGEKDG